MATRNLYQEPPYKGALLQRDQTVSLLWLSWFNAVARFGKVLQADAAFDPPAIGAGARQIVNVPCAGARPGDFAQVSVDPANESIALLAQVVSNDSVSVIMWNTSAGSIDLAAGTIRVRVEQAQ